MVFFIHFAKVIKRFQVLSCFYCKGKVRKNLFHADLADSADQIAIIKIKILQKSAKSA